MALPAACKAFSGTGTFSNVKPLRASEPGDEGMEAKASEGYEDSHLFPRHFRGPPIVPRTPSCADISPRAMRGPGDTAHTKCHPSHCFPFPIRKASVFGLCPQLYHSHMSILVRQGALEWSPPRGCVRQVEGQSHRTPV